jgi:hypothetical protein
VEGFLKKSKKPSGVGKRVCGGETGGERRKVKSERERLEKEKEKEKEKKKKREEKISAKIVNKQPKFRSG